MGGLFESDSPREPMVTPLEYNAGAFGTGLDASTAMQQNLMLSQMATSNKMEMAAADAAAEQLREITLRDAEAERDKIERDRRMKKGKRDLLFGTALGVDNEEDDEDSMLLLGD